MALCLQCAICFQLAALTWGEPHRSPPRDRMCSRGDRSPVGLHQCRNVITWLKLSEEELTAPARAENQKEKHLFDWASLFLRLKCRVLKMFCLKTTSMTDLILFSFDHHFFFYKFLITLFKFQGLIISICISYLISWGWEIQNWIRRGDNCGVLLFSRWC